MGARRLATLALVGALPSLVSARTDAQRQAGIRVQAVAQGVRLSLSVSRRVYPRDALTRVMVRLQNTTGRTFQAWIGDGFIPGSDTPQVEVVSDANQVLYPPALPPLTVPEMGQGGYGPAPIRLGPGQAVERHPYVILRARRLLATVHLALDGNGASGAAFDLTTPPVILRLLSGKHPYVRFGTQPYIHATIRPATPVHGPLLYVDIEMCPTMEVRHAQWQPFTDGHTFYVRCLVQEWHLAAGWLNQPVATVNYMSRTEG